MLYNSDIGQELELVYELFARVGQVMRIKLHTIIIKENFL